MSGSRGLVEEVVNLEKVVGTNRFVAEFYDVTVEFMAPGQAPFELSTQPEDLLRIYSGWRDAIKAAQKMSEVARLYVYPDRLEFEFRGLNATAFRQMKSFLCGTLYAGVEANGLLPRAKPAARTRTSSDIEFEHRIEAAKRSRSGHRGL